MDGRFVSILSGTAWLTAALSLHASELPPVAGWDPAAAARYLDSRMDVWWENAKSLQTGSAEAKCISCHTAVPYAWARPALRRASGVVEPTAHEERILDFVRRRVEYAASEQPYYDHNEYKKIESRGVEAVLNAFVLTGRDLELGSPEPSAPTVAAISRLWDVQRGDGAWDWLDFGLEPYETPDAVFQGATMAALAVGSEPGMRASAGDRGRAGLERLRAYFRSSLGSQRLFNRACALLASSRLEGILTDVERETILRDLEWRQRPDGGWSLADLGTWRWTRQEAPPYTPPGVTDSGLLAASDGYATGLVVYAMRQAGRAVESPAVRKGQQWLREHQAPERANDPSWAPWRAHSLNYDREHGGPKGEPWRRMFMSDLATAFAVLALLQ